MIVRTHPNFDKHFKKRIKPYPKLVIKFQERIDAFLANPRDPILKDHQLTGDKSGFRSFSVTGNYRVTYEKITKDEVILMDIGTHPQVY